MILVLTKFCILAQLFVSLRVTGFQPTVLRHCCDLGAQWYEDGDKACPQYPVPEPHTPSQVACSIVVGVCCLGHRRQEQCLRGKQTALVGKSCHSVAEEEDAAECCGCCELGLLAAEAGINCDGPSHFSAQCRVTYKSCCSENKKGDSVSMTTKSSVVFKHLVPPREISSDKQGPGSSDEYQASFLSVTRRQDQANLEYSATGPELVADECARYQGRLCSQLCISLPRGFRCDCHPGFELQPDRRTCRRPTEETVTRDLCLDSNDCDQVCRMKRDRRGIECLCYPGYALNRDARTCSDVNECTSTEFPHNCTDAERCINTFGGFSCQPKDDADGLESNKCPDGLTWNRIYGRCEDIDECQSGRHRCVPGTICVNKRGSYDCLDYRNAIHSAWESSATTARPLDRSWHPAEPPATEPPVEEGYDDVTTPEYQVRTKTSHLPKTNRCSSGYEVNHETGLCQDIDECQVKGNGNGCPLMNMVCRNTVGSYLCTCQIGFQFNPRSQLCEDLDECRRRRHDCLAYEICINTIGSYICRSVSGNCSRGYAIDMNSRRCTDIDECSQSTRLCSPGSICVNTPGAFRCQKTCERGLRLDSTGNCVDMDECRERPGICRPNQECKNTVGSYVCRSLVSCGAGYIMNVHGTRCEDINECQTGQHNCNATLMTCVNRPGTYACQCPEGYQMNHAKHTCDDVDECHRFGGHVCNQNARCENTQGSFRCVCQEGFQLEPNSKYCSDINECRQLGMCQHSCRNTWGSYYCTCNDGYQLSRDGRTCSDIDECAVWMASGRSSDLCLGLCHNIPGSYLCSCPAGYQMTSDGRQCQDVDECTRGLSGCNDPDEVCVNSGGSFECRLILCPRGFVKAPKIQQSPRPRQANVEKDPFEYSRGREEGEGGGERMVHEYFRNGVSFRFTGRPSSNQLRGVVARPIQFVSNEDSGVVCQKVECEANDIACILNMTKTIQWQHVSLPTIQLVSDPIIIINVQPIAYSVYPNNEFYIIGGNEQGLFDVIKIAGHEDRGAVRLLKPIKGPAEYTLTLRMDNHNRYHNVISQHLAHVSIKVSPYRF